MAMFGKQIMKKPVSSTGSGPNFSEPLWYSKTFFGIRTISKDELVTVYVLDLSVSSLEKNFSMFEDMANVHEWPISKIIQRELNQQRASLICRDYLLADGYLKYFPPLTAVLIPTDKDYAPSDKYPKARKDEEDSLDRYIKQQNVAPEGQELEQDVLVGGVYDVHQQDNTNNGLFLWDKNVVTAVIIDGQHRYKALLEAMHGNKDFQQCKVSINLIDLVSICERENLGPTAVARDLFVTINNTPVEVDEARLVLMDDRDALATFTQVLVDDSDGTVKPAVPPELIDWKCEQGKHDIELSLTGVLTLRGVIGSAMFDNKSIASVDSRSDMGLVRKWLSNLTKWVDPDELIRKELPESETLKHRYAIACPQGEANDDDDEEYPFLFSYSASAAELVKRRFKELYLDVYRAVYQGLTPYKEVIECATEAGAFDKKKELHTYLRAFAGKRRGLEKESIELKRAAIAYKKKLGKLTQNSISHTVMGQKAIFKALFEGYLSEAPLPLKRADLLKGAKQFVEHFNESYGLLHQSKSFDENFYSTKLRLKKSVEASAAGDLGKEFWRGIILGYKGEIDYGPTAVDILKSVLLDILLFDNEPPFEFSERGKIINRHISILRKFDSEISDARAEKVAQNIVAAKEKLVGAWLG